MTFERKRGTILLEGAKPMEFVESDNLPSKVVTPEQEAEAATVANAISEYLIATERLTAGQYSEARNKIPDYLAEPGQALVIICTDGIVIRYERRSDAERAVRVSIMPGSIAEAAAVASQNLIHIESPELATPQNDNFGVMFGLKVGSSEGMSQTIMDARIWFQVKRTVAPEGQQPGSKPYCLTSVRNQLVLELHGEMGTESGARGQPFVARSNIRLFAGWDCVEVFPGFNAERWDAKYAPLWAERDVQGAVLIAHAQDAHLATLDPRASARRAYVALLREFKALLDSNPEREQVLQTFLQKNPILLCPAHVRMWPKLPLGIKVTDFVFRDATQEYILVEIERSNLQLFRRDEHPTAELTHALSQIVDWKRYLEDNLQTVQRELGLVGITANPQGLVVIGRSQSLTPTIGRKLQAMANQTPKLRIATYDDVYDNAKAVIENLLGPIWDPGGSTEVYYPLAN